MLTFILNGPNAELCATLLADFYGRLLTWTSLAPAHVNTVRVVISTGPQTGVAWHMKLLEHASLVGNVAVLNDSPAEYGEP
jgi:hypothetical protein